MSFQLNEVAKKRGYLSNGVKEEQLELEFDGEKEASPATLSDEEAETVLNEMIPKCGILGKRKE